MATPIVDKLTISEIRGYRAMRIVKIKNGETPKPSRDLGSALDM